MSDVKTRSRPDGAAVAAALKDVKPTALDLPPQDPLDPGVEKLFAVCLEKLGLIPNVLAAHAFAPAKLDGFSRLYNELMLADSGLSKLEREMIAVVVSAVNGCFYCLTAHGAAVRTLSGDPTLGEMLVMNYRVAPLDRRQRAMLDFAVKLTKVPGAVEEEDRAALREVGFSDHDIWDIVNVAAFFNMSNRVAAGVDMRPNPEYQAQAR